MVFYFISNLVAASGKPGHLSVMGAEHLLGNPSES